MLQEAVDQGRLVMMLPAGQHGADRVHRPFHHCAIKELRAIAANGPASVPATERFQITINLGADTLVFDKSIEINPNDVPENIDTTSQGVFETITTKRDGDDDQLI